MNGKDLYRAFSGIDDRYLAMACSYQKENIAMKKQGKLRYFLIAAALISLLGVTAYAVNSQIQLSTQRYRQGTDETVEANASAPYDASITFTSTAEEYVGLQSYRPTWVPDGYRLRFVGPKAFGNQTLHYETDTDPSALVLEVTRGTEGANMVLEDVAKEEAVAVGGLPGTLLTSTSGERVLIWTDEEKGVGFLLITEDTGLDLMHVAESVRPDSALQPTNADRARLALEELGDYRITGLPANCPETEFTASPKEDGGDWYAYVYRWYIDAKQNDVVLLEYESFLLNGDKDEPQVEETPETILAMYGGGDTATVQGMQAVVTDGKIVWVDWEQKVVFQISAENFSREQLQQLADSVQKAN